MIKFKWKKDKSKCQLNLIWRFFTDKNQFIAKKVVEKPKFEGKDEILIFAEKSEIPAFVI